MMRSLLVLLCCVCGLSAFCPTTAGLDARELALLDRVVGWVDFDAANGVDRWRIDAQTDGVLIVSLIGMDWESDIDLWLLDSNGEILDVSRNAGAEYESIIWQTPTGVSTYFAEVRARGPGAAGGYILRSFVTPMISLLLFRGEDDGIPEATLESLGFREYQLVTSTSDFIDALQAESWDLIILYEAPTSSASFVEALLEYLEGDGTCIITDYDLREDVRLLEGMGASRFGSADPRVLWNVYPIPSTSLCLNPYVLTALRTSLLALLTGNILQAESRSKAAATYELQPGLDAIVVSHEGRAVLNAFDLWDLDEVDAENLLADEVAYVLMARSHGKETSPMDWWYRTPIERAKDLVEEAKHAAALGQIETAVDRLIAVSPFAESQSLIAEDFVPGPDDAISEYRRIAEGLNDLVARMAELTEIATVFFNDAAWYTVQEKVADPFKEFEATASRQLETAALWARDLLAELDRVEDTGLSCYPFPPAPAYTTFYPAYEALDGLLLCSFEVVNYSEQTQSVTIIAESTSLTAEETVELVIAPRSSRMVQLTPTLLPSAMELESPELADLVLSANGIEYGPYPVQFLPGEWPPHPMLYPTLIAWVTPQDPVVMDVVDAALTEFPDAETGGATGIREKARVLWNALEDRKFEYMDASPAYGSASQRVRLPGEALAEGGGNCIEGSLLMASMLEAAGVDPLVLIAPLDQHSMVGWEASPGNYEFVETTFGGSSILSFETAVLWGTRAWTLDYSVKNQIWLESMSLDHEVNLEAVYILDVRALRRAWDEIASGE